MSKDTIGTVLALLFVVLLLAVVAIVSIKAPCDAFKYAANKDIPARCLKEFQK